MRDNSTDRVCTCVVCLSQFTPNDRRSKGRICTKADCRREWARRAASKPRGGTPRPIRPRITPPTSAHRTVLQPCIAPYLATLAAASPTRTD